MIILGFFSIYHKRDFQKTVCFETALKKISFTRNHFRCSKQISSLMVSITRFRKDERHKQQHKPWWEITSEKSRISEPEHVHAIPQNKGKPNKQVIPVSSVWGCFPVPEARCTRGECATRRVPSPAPLLVCKGKGAECPGARRDGAHTNTSPSALDTPRSDWGRIRAQ